MLLGKEIDMLRVIAPTVFGFVALMSIWGFTTLTYISAAA
jgi:hypothetical protein